MIQIFYSQQTIGTRVVSNTIQFPLLKSEWK